MSDNRNFVKDGITYTWVSDEYPVADAIIGTGIIKGISHELVDRILDKWQLTLELKDLPASYFVFNNIRSLSGSCGVSVVQAGEIVGTRLFARA